MPELQSPAGNPASMILGDRNPMPDPGGGGDPTAVTDPAVAKPPEKMSPALQILVQREKRAMEIERRARQKEQEIEARGQSFQEREQKLKEFEELMSANPLKAIEKYGKSYKDLTDIALNDGNVPVDHEVKKLKEEFEAYRRSNEEAERRKVEDEKLRAEQNEARVVGEFKTAIKDLISKEAKRYELILFDGQEDLVYDVIDEHYNRTINPDTGKGEVLDKAEAADRVEKWLRETKYAKINDLEFFKSKLSPQQFKPEVKQELNFRPQQHRTTLTNQLSASPAKPRTRPITDDERIAKAIAYAKGLRP